MAALMKPNILPKFKLWKFILSESQAYWPPKIAFGRGVTALDGFQNWIDYINKNTIYPDRVYKVEYKKYISGTNLIVYLETYWGKIFHAEYEWVKDSKPISPRAKIY